VLKKNSQQIVELSVTSVTEETERWRSEKITPIIFS
jgi:hypothetical protein